ncbi:MAG: response regulator, partial [Bacteroidota bacterium]
MAEPLHLLIVEDEMLIAADLSLTLEELGYVVDAILPRGEAALKHVKAMSPDLLLLDIRLKGQLDGIETATALRAAGYNGPLIYLTANDDKATFQRAKATQPDAFLSKPYDRDQLDRAIALALAKRPTTVQPRTSQEETATNTAPQGMKDRIFVRHNNRMVKLALGAIRYVEAERAYCRIATDDTTYLLSMPLSNLSKQLPPERFVRIHRSYLVNLNRVD